MNKLLVRQIQKTLGDSPDLPESWQALLEVISETYDGFDTDRRLIERSLDISSKELREVNQKLRKEIKERQQAEDRQKYHLKDAMKANDELMQFAYVISHDLKTPLRGISTLAAWLDSDFGEMLDDAARKNIRHLGKRVQRMYRLIDDLLVYLRLQPDPDRLSPVNLTTLIPQIIRTLDIPKGIEIVVDEELPEVLFEERRIAEVIYHLLTNAIKFIGRQDGRITFTCQAQDSDWVFTVTDNGPGIHRQHHERVFELFRTLHHWEETNSTGIGLPMVKKIIEMHGGQVWLESDYEGGCRISFTVPHLACQLTPEHLCTTAAKL